MGQNYGYETLMTLLPTFMKQILHFDIKSVKTASGELLTRFDAIIECTISEWHRFLAPLPGHVDILDGGVARGRLDDLQQQVHSRLHAQDSEHHRSIGSGDRPDRCLLHRVQLLADRGHSYDRRRFERRHLLRIQSEPPGHFTEIRRRSHVLHQLLGQFGRLAGTHHRWIYHRRTGNRRVFTPRDDDRPRTR